MRVFLVVIMCCTAPSALTAQTGWGITTEVGQSWFSGGARRDSAGVDYFQPSPSRYASLRVDRNGSRIGFAATLLYERTGLRSSTNEAEFVLHDLATLYSIRPEVLFRGLTLGAVRLDPHGGMGIEYWQFSGEDSRVRLSVLAGLTLMAPLGGSFSFRLRWEAGLGGSLFKDSELPAAFEMRTSIHSRLGFGIRLGL